MNAIDDEVAAVRGFNRFYTGVIGVLREGLLDSPYSLTEVRVLFELNQRSAMDVADLRQLLGLDAGYLSRIFARFEEEGLAARERSHEDGRRQVAKLTAAGRRVYRKLDGLSAGHVRSMLERLSQENRRRLIASMATIHDVLQQPPTPRSYLLRPPGSGDFGWVVQRHGAVYREEYGFDERFEALVARIIADFVEHADPRRASGWIAEVDGKRAGSVFCAGKDKRTAQLRLLLVEPEARGLGIGGRLVDECVQFARRAGYKSIVLWTNDILHDARRVYERAGFTLDREEPHCSYGCDLVGQYWSRSLT